MSSIFQNNKGQIMMLETVFFAATVIMALLFLYQLSPSSVKSDVFMEDLEVMGDEALYSIYTEALPEEVAETYPSGYPSSKLVHYLITNGYGGMISDLHNLLPSTVLYHIYVSNGDDTMFWCDSLGNTVEENKIASIDPISVVFCMVPIDPIFIDPATNEVLRNAEEESAALCDVFSEYTGSLYEVQLKIWYI